MTESEFQKFFNYVSSVTTDTKPSPQRMEVYWDALNDLPFDIAMIAAKKIITTLENPFLPMPATFRKAAAEITQPNIFSAGEAYETVLRAIRNFGSYREADALNSLDPLTAKAVRAVGWKPLCLSEQPDIVRAQFRKAYEAMQVRAEESVRMPETLKDAIGMVSEKVKIPEYATKPTIEDFSRTRERRLAELEEKFGERT